MKYNIFVSGGTGKTGRRVADRLTQLKHRVRMGSRNNKPAFDWTDFSTFPNVLKGMDRAYITYYPDLAVPGAKEAIRKFAEVALKEGLEKVVLLSGKGEKEAEMCEDIVASSGLNYTLVRASWFNQNFNESFLLEPILAGHVALPMSDVKIPFVDADDISDVVTETILNDAHNNKLINVTGPQKLTFKEVIEEIAKETKRKITFEDISIETYTACLKAAGLPEDYVWLLGYLFEEVLGKPGNQVVSHDVEKVLGRKATDFKTFVKNTAATGIWNQSIPQTI